MGLDRALAAFGACEKYGYPSLVIDGGTALTLTGIDPEKKLFGGAILPGIKLQLTSLNTQTAALPKVDIGNDLPSRWGKNTESAIHSGVLYFILAGIEDFIKSWRQQFPDSLIIFTGGDGKLIFNYLQTKSTDPKLTLDPDLIFIGISKLVFNAKREISDRA